VRIFLFDTLELCGETLSSNGKSPKQTLAERFAPVLVMWPEIPWMVNPSANLRHRHARVSERSASRVLSGAHITRDFHPRDVRLSLHHAQAWDPRPPLPIVPAGLTRVYRDFARFFFWPIAALLVVNLLILALGQGLDRAPRLSIEIGTLSFLGILYLVTFRSPILAPVDSWHQLNNLLVASGLATSWLVTFGAGGLWYIGLILFAPSAIVLLTSFAIREWSGFAGLTLLPLRWARGSALWLLNSRAHHQPRWRESRVLQGVKPAHEYTHDSELFYRHPRDGRPIHRSDREAHWAAYSRIMGRDGGNYPITYYARVLNPDADGVTAIQYWFFYYYNDWAHEHEGDWESVLVLLRGEEPVAVAASTHEAGEIRDWMHVEQQDGHPVLYVAAGSHAFYFQSGAFLAERSVAGLRVTSIDAALFGKEVLDYVDFTSDGEQGVEVRGENVILIPDPDLESGLWGHIDHDSECIGDCSYNLEWLNYEGRWGAVGISVAGGFSGPRGPTESGLSWANPYLWVDTVCRPCPVCSGEMKDSRGHKWNRPMDH
jgi:hypothetical protein